MTTNPEQIRNEIERTRASLSDDVNALAEEIRPSSVVRRQRRKVTGVFVNAKDRVMGTAAEARSTATDTLDAAGDTVTKAPQQIRRQTRGNPLAAGLVAFGVGMVVASLLPSSEPERQAASRLKEDAEPVVEDVKQSAQEAAEHMKQPAREAAQSVKETAADGAAHVKAATS